MNVKPLDIAILVAVFLSFLGIAIYINRRIRSVADYLVSGRKVRMWLGMGAGIAGEIGLVAIVATCEQGYLRGYSFIFLALLQMLILVPLFGVFGFGIERFRATRAMSVPQYIEMRYDKNLRVLTGIFNSLAGVIQMCVFPITGARFIRVLIHAPEYLQVGNIEIQTAWLIMAGLLSCVIIFTYLGGYITLIVTNFFQMIIIVVALHWIFFLLVYKIGMQELWTNLEQQKGLAAFYPFTGESGSYGIIWFSWLMMMSILLQFSYGPYLQKYASMDKPKTVSRSYLLSQLFGNGRTFVILGLGVAALAVLGTEASAGLDVKPVIWQKMATPYYLGQVIGTGLLGFLLAGLLFSDVATTDQYILSWSTSIVNDCICPFKKEPFKPKSHIMAVRITILILCLLFFFYGLFDVPTTPLWEYLWLCGSIICGTGVAMLFGMYWKRGNTPGAYAAVFTCLILPIADLAARRIYNASDKPFPIKPETTGFITFVLAVALYVIISLATKSQSKYWDLGKQVKEMNA